MAGRHPGAKWAVPLVLAAGLAAGGWLVVDGTSTGLPPQPSAADAFQNGPSPAPQSAVGRAPGPRPLPASVPVRIRITKIGVNAPLVPLGLDSARHLQVPPDDDKNLAGWYRGGPTPGEAGNALIDGHVDNWHGPAVFYGLGALHKGDTVEVDRRDGTAAVFGIDAIEVYARNSFPDRKVYGATTDPELRLITCGGGYTRSTGYLGNVVVYAHLTADRRATHKPSHKHSHSR